MSTLKRIAVALVLLVSCAHAPPRMETPDTIETMMASTVQINVTLAITLIRADGTEIPLPLQGWTGSGVIYDKAGGWINPISSKILTANHVLETPRVGEEQAGALGILHVDAVLISVTGYNGRSCELTPVKLGVSDYRDVATGTAQCDLGPVAPIASRLPPIGGKVVVTGHPLGVKQIITTEGIFAGWYGQYMMTSAPITHGNSGGPVWYNGEVVGLAVRGTDYPNLSIVAPLEQVLERIK